MNERIKLRDRRSRAFWSRRLRCTDTELREAVRATHSIVAIDLCIYLLTRRALEAFRPPAELSAA